MVGVFSIPSVQSSTARWLAQNFSEDNNVHVQVQKLEVDWDGNVILTDLLALGESNDTIIHIGTLETSILGFGQLASGNVNLGVTEIDDFTLNIIREKGQKKDNLARFLDKLSKPKTNEPAKSTFVEVNDLSLANGRVNVIDYNLNYPESFVAKDVHLDLNRLSIVGDKLIFDVEDMDLLMYNGAMKSENGSEPWLAITNLNTLFTYTPEYLTAENLIIETGGSRLEGDLRWDYTAESFKDFENEVKWKLNIASATVATNEIYLWYPEIIKNRDIALSGNMTGNLEDFYVKNLDASTTGLAVKGDASFENVVENAEDFEISGNFKKLQANRESLSSFLPNILPQQLPSRLSQFGMVTASGDLSIDANSVDMDLYATTRQGNVIADVLISDLKKVKPAYRGHVELDNFNVRSIGDFEIERAGLALDIEGRGFNLNTLDLNLSGGVRYIEWNGYRYKNIQVDGDFTRPVFNGHLEIDDPNVKLVFDGLVDASEKINVYDFVADVQYADLHAVNLIDRDTTSILRGKVNMDMKGTDINDAYGTIAITDASYKNQNDTYSFDDFKIESEFINDERLITINSKEIMDGELRGRFYLEQIPALVQNSLASLYTDYRIEEVRDDQFIAYEFQLYDKIIDLFYPKLKLGENTVLKGNLSSNDDTFKLTFRTPSIRYGDLLFDKVNVQIDNKNPLFNTYVQLDRFDNGFYDLKEFKLINVTVNDTLQFRTEFKSDQKLADEYKFSLFHTIQSDSLSRVGLREGEALFNGRKWAFAKAEKAPTILFDHALRGFTMDTLAITSKNQRIELGGSIQGKDDKNLFLDMTDVRLSSLISPIDSLSLKGLVNGDIHVKQEKGIYYPTSQLDVTDFLVNDTPLGDFVMDITGDQTLTEYRLDAHLKDDIKKSFRASGTISTATEENQLDIIANLNKFNVVALSPLGGLVVDNVRGLASGNIEIKGNLRKPEINGRLDLYNAGLRFPYLNTDFDFQELTEIGVNSNGFDFGTINLTDTEYGTQGVLKGEITHKNFGFWALDLAIESDRLLVLDTQKQENSLYYGTGFIDGSATITGPVNELFIDVKAETKKGTEFYIPLADTEGVGDSAVIYFLSPSDKQASTEGKVVKLETSKGLELRFDIDITSEALVEVTIDEQYGSFLRGRGSGDLLIEINTNGKFRMFGDYQIDEGIYNFRYSLINKQFQILPGGNIIWQGEPTDAMIDVEAVYRTNANPAVLLDNPSLNTRIPVEVVTNLTGNLEFFDPEFEIEFPNANSVVASELQYRLQERSQRQLQALSLMSSGTFYNPNSIGQNAVTGNLVESISGLVNDWVGDDDSALNFGLNYEASERNPNTEFQNSDRLGITVSTKISDRVLINGRVGVPVGGAGTANERSVIGNVRVDFLINEDGTLRLKIFNRENNLQQLGQQRGYTQGLGFTYTVDFDTMKELFEKIFNKELDREG